MCEDCVLLCEDWVLLCEDCVLLCMAEAESIYVVGRGEVCVKGRGREALLHCA